jgi:hypothetical protein
MTKPAGDFMLRTMLLSILIAAAGIGQGFAQADRSGVLAPNNRFCLVQRETAAVNCMFATMQQCLQSANVGREGECIANPALGALRYDPREQR